MAKVFISYRRSDSQHAVDRLQGAMRPYVKSPKKDIFVDVDNIPIGRDFEEHLQGKVSECDALLAVIGPDWLSSLKEDGTRRLDDPEDFVRTEIAAALSRNIPVVPVLLDGARVPLASELPDNLKALAKRNGAQLDRKSFAADVDHIMTGLAAVAAIAVGGWYGVTQLNLFPAGGNDAAPAEEIAELLPPEPDQEAFTEPAEDAEYRAELIVRYQAALGALEYYDGIVDGVPGDATHDASKAFTTEHNRMNLGLDFANLDALERLVVYAEDTLETKELNDARLEQQKADAEEKLAQEIADKRAAEEDALEREIERERLAAAEAVKPDWAKGLTGLANRLAEGCLKNIALDCNELGEAYDGQFANPGVPRNYVYARELYGEACNGGNMIGCLNLGNIYYGGLGTSVDFAQARVLYAKACDDDLLKGCRNLGSLYTGGLGVSVDYGRARTLYTKACDGGDMGGCNNLAVLYHDGLGVPVDKARAKNLFTKTCNGGDAIACTSLSEHYP